LVTGMNDLARHFDWVSKNDRKARQLQRGFHEQIAEQLRQLIPRGSRVLEVGCGRGELLRRLEPSRGLGLDLSEGMLAQARAADATAKCEYRLGDACSFPFEETFDYIVADYLAGYLPDIQACFDHLRSAAHARTRLCVTSVNHA
jgi:ubiquinone/menaquinone biosynthesis C-methylase UbiE